MRIIATIVKAIIEWLIMVIISFYIFLVVDLVSAEIGMGSEDFWFLVSLLLSMVACVYVMKALYDK